MDDLATPETWTPQDDAFIRDALRSLRADVEATPLSEPEFVRARGDNNRRRRMLVMTAGVAAAVAIVAAIGFRGIVDKGAAPPPLPAGPTPTLASTTPTRTSAPTPTATPTPSTSRSPSTRPSGTATPRSTARPTSSATAPVGNPSPTGTRGPGSTPGTPVEIVTAGTPAIPVSAFLTIEQWQAANTFGGTIGSVGTDEIGVAAVTQCDPNAEARPAALGWVTDASGWSGWNAVERIQASNLQSDGSTNATEPAAIVRAMLDATCTYQGKPVKISAGPRSGTAVVEYNEPDSESGALVVVTDLVGAVALPDGQRTATFVLQHAAASDTGWAFLSNLMDAAAAT